MTTYLLDVNVLLALFDPNHVMHEPAHDWFASKGRHSWATCPMTENGFVRVASHPSYPSSPGRPAAVLKQLRLLCEAKGHDFWEDEVSLTDSKIFSPAGLLTASQITDVYLLGLAAHRAGKLATFDTRIPLAAVLGGAKAVELILSGAAKGGKTLSS